MINLTDLSTEALHIKKAELEHTIQNHEETLKTWDSVLGRLFLSSSLRKEYRELQEINKLLDLKK